MPERDSRQVVDTSRALGVVVHLTARCLGRCTEWAMHFHRHTPDRGGSSLALQCAQFAERRVRDKLGTGLHTHQEYRTGSGVFGGLRPATVVSLHQLVDDRHGKGPAVRLGRTDVGSRLLCIGMNAPRGERTILSDHG